MNLIQRYVPFLFLIALLSGCSSLPESTTNVEWQTHQQRLEDVKSYQAFGKLGYISPQQRQSLNFHWEHSNQTSRLRLTTFLGQTVMNLSITPQGATIETYDDQILTDSSADRLVYRLTGLVIPVQQLQNWLLGKPSEADNYTVNQTNTLASLSKQINGQDWNLEFLSYRDQQFLGTPLPLPSKLKLQHDTTKLNIVVSKWILE